MSRLNAEGTNNQYRPKSKEPTIYQTGALTPIGEGKSNRHGKAIALGTAAVSVVALGACGLSQTTIGEHQTNPNTLPKPSPVPGAEKTPVPEAPKTPTPEYSPEVQKTLDNMNAWKNKKNTDPDILAIEQSTATPQTNNSDVANTPVTLSLMYTSDANGGLHLLNPNISVGNQGGASGWAVDLGTFPITDSSTHILHHAVALGIFVNGQPEVLTADLGADGTLSVPESHPTSPHTTFVSTAQLAQDLDSHSKQIISVGFGLSFNPGTWQASHDAASNAAADAWVQGNTNSPAFKTLTPGAVVDTTSLPLLFGPQFLR